MTSYAFGDSALAAERLAVVAEVFEETSRRFLERSVTSPPELALDLGCGPGHSTRLVARTTRARRTIGIDASLAFLELAVVDPPPPGVEFVAYDVTAAPLPGAPADLVYSRLLLAHLPDAADQATRWMTQVAPGGVLLVDEVEWIETSHPVLARYEELVVDVVALHGGASYAGPIVAAMPVPDGWTRRSDLHVVRVATADAARMYGMNLATWRHDPAIAQRCAPSAVDALADDLAALGTSARTSEITWGIRQVAFEHSG
ncbi:MAG TPA: class I SAM-dependent methyltransferase [Acidimicrobiia bacterium]|jgi:SAM-dependent methyltransferase